MMHPGQGCLKAVDTRIKQPATLYKKGGGICYTLSYKAGPQRSLREPPNYQELRYNAWKRFTYCPHTRLQSFPSPLLLLHSCQSRRHCQCFILAATEQGP
jgi:hypothetical protein